VWVFVVRSPNFIVSVRQIRVLLTTHDYPKAEQPSEKLAASPLATGHVLLAQIYNATGRWLAGVPDLRP
jgi:hypothetical protein